MGAIDPNVVVGGLLTSVPATIAACAAWRSSRSTNKKIDTNHGKSPGQYLEETHQAITEHVKVDERVWAYLKVPEEVLTGDTSASS